MPFLPQIPDIFVELELAMVSQSSGNAISANIFKAQRRIMILMVTILIGILVLLALMYKRDQLMFLEGEEEQESTGFPDDKAEFNDEIVDEEPL